MPSTDPTHDTPRRQLSLFDCVCIIVGVIIGSGIFETSPTVAQQVGGLGMLAVVWLLGGLISLIGALCFAELATAYPRDGGDYVYLSRAFGRRVGLLFAWASFWIVRPGNIGAMAFVFATYAAQLWPIPSDYGNIIYAVGAVVPLTILNIIGVKPGKWTQNILTAIKVAGLLIVVTAGFFAERPPRPVEPISSGSFGLAMILILFTFGGWNEVAYVAAEVRDPRKNILRSLVLGTTVVTGVYLLVNFAAVAALGLHGLRNAPTFAADVAGTRAISVLVCVSCLGAINGMTFTGARIFYAVGTEHRMCRWFGQWHPRFATPARALLLQAAATVALMVAFGLYEDGFERLVVFTGPVFWGFLLLTGIALFVLRFKDGDKARPYKVWLYPITPVLFCASAAYMVYATLSYAWIMRHVEGWWTIALIVAGVVWVCFDKPQRQTSDS